jgi:hypothetical protein
MLATVLAAWPAPAQANPKKLPYSYGPMTVPSGALEWETIIDLTPVRVGRERADGTLEGIFAPRYLLQTELEYGLTDKLELGLYLLWRQGASADTPFLRFEGLKQRVRWRLADPGAWPIDVALYFEVAELVEEIELEEKVILRRSFGPLELLMNLWIEQEWYFIDDETKFVYNPTVGAAYEISPAVTVGLEYWARGRFDREASSARPAADDDAPRSTRHYLGPTLMLQRGDYWLATGAYLRLDALSTSLAVDDQFGRIWIRLILGVGL